jgi:hypothetical protein
MRNYEIIKAVYKRCPKAARDGFLTREQLFDRCLDVIDLIERERPAIAKENREKEEV